MNQMKWQRDDHSGLDYLARESAQSRVAIVLLHGYGADCTDLAGLADFLGPADQFSWFFPNGPLEVDIGAHVSGRAWFPINMQRLQLAQMTGEFERYLASGIPEGFLEVSKKVEQFLSELKGRYDKVILGGFSQGSMVSAQVALTRPDLLAGLILLSSTFVSEASWRDLVSNDISYPILQSHGTSDPVLPFKDAVRLSEFLKEHTQDFKFISFQGGHEIPPKVLTEVQQFASQIQAGQS